MRGRGVKLPRGLLFANGVLLVLAIVFGSIFLSIAAVYPETEAADRWQGSGETRFTQISCFLPWDQTKSQEDVVLFRRSLDERLQQESLSGDGVSLYADAYSAEGTVTVSTDFGKASVKTFGVGGDFFLFHPYNLRCGSLFSPRDLMQDKVVLDENLAWSLFGSKDVAGLTVYIGNIPFLVSGVVQREEKSAADAAFSSDESLLIMPYDAFYALTEQGISCYEIVLTNPVSGYGMKLMEDLFQIGGGEMREYTNRFSVKNLMQVVRDFGKRSMVRSRVVYPYWENALRMTEDWLSVLLVLLLAILALPLLSVFVTLVILAVTGGKWLKKIIPAFVDRKIQKGREKRYAKQK